MEQEIAKLLARMSELADAIKRLEQRVNGLEQRAGMPAVQQPKPQPTRPAPAVEKRAQSPGVNWKLVELNLGKYALQIVGIAVFLAGMGFFLKYAIDQNWISPAVRVLLGVAVATGCIVGAELLRIRLKKWMGAVAAGGVVLYYFSLYAAYSLYGLISGPVSLGASIGITALAAALSLRHNSQTLALCSLVGGFATPFLIYGVQAEPQLLVYYSVFLTVGFVLLTYMTNWYSLTELSFGAFFLYCNLPPVINYSVGLYAWYLLLMLAVFSGIPCIAVQFWKRGDRYFEPILVTISGLYIFERLYTTFKYKLHTGSFDLGIQFLNNLFQGATSEQLLEYLCVGFAVVYGVLLFAMLAVRCKNMYLLGTLFTMTVSFVTGVILAHWQGYVLSIVLHSYALMLLLLGIYARQRYVRVIAYGMWVLSVVQHLFVPMFHAHDVGSGSWYILVNVATAINVALFVLAAWLVRRYKERFTEGAAAVATWLEVGAIMTVVYWFHTSVFRHPGWIVLLSIYAMFVIFIGLRYAQLVYRLCGYGIAAFAGLYWWICMTRLIRFSPFDSDYYLIQQKYSEQLLLAWLLLIGLLGSMRLAFERYRGVLLPFEQRYATRLINLLLLCVIFTWARVAWIFLLDTPTEHGYARQTQTDLVLAVYYGLFALTAIVIGLRKYEPWIRYFGLGLVCLVLWRLWFIIMGLPETLHRVGAFVVVGICLTVASLVYQKLDRTKS